MFLSAPNILQVLPIKTDKQCKKFVLGTPVNNVDPALPGINSHSTFGSLQYSITNLAACSFLGNKIGQKGADGHSDTISVPWALVLSACCITLGTKFNGGHHQLTSPCQLQVKASTASVSASQNLELNLSNCVLLTLAICPQYVAPTSGPAGQKQLGGPSNHHSQSLYSNSQPTGSPP